MLWVIHIYLPFASWTLVRRYGQVLVHLNPYDNQIPVHDQDQIKKNVREKERGYCNKALHWYKLVFSKLYKYPNHILTRLLLVTRGKGTRFISWHLPPKSKGPGAIESTSLLLWLCLLIAWVSRVPTIISLPTLLWINLFPSFPTTERRAINIYTRPNCKLVRNETVILLFWRQATEKHTHVCNTRRSYTCTDSWNDYQPRHEIASCVK